MDIDVTREALAAMHEAATNALPNEACGILLGEGVRILAYRPAINVHPAPRTHFEIDPQALIDAHRDARAGGYQVLGYFHSHPSGPAQPSATDAAMAANDGSIWAIFGTLHRANGPEHGVRFFCAGKGGFAELSLTENSG